MFHKIKQISVLPNFVLLAQFFTGEEKIYDMKPLIKENSAFVELKRTPGLFALAKVDVGGYGIVWNQEIDLDAEEVYQNGTNATVA